MRAEFDFTDEVVLVTGASGALGGAVSEAFADAGATVCGTARSAPGGFPGEFYTGDLTEEADARRVVRSVLNDVGKLDHLCNVAGAWRGGTPIAETDVETFDFVLDVNLKTAFLASKHALSHLREAGGTVVCVSATSALEGGSGDGPYRAAKAGVRRLTESIAAENEGEVRANCVLPSVIDTPANREAMPDADFDDWTDPADIAEVVLFLCSDAASVTSGASVPVDGS